MKICPHTHIYASVPQHPLLLTHTTLIILTSHSGHYPLHRFFYTTHSQPYRICHHSHCSNESAEIRVINQLLIMKSSGHIQSLLYFISYALLSFLLQTLVWFELCPSKDLIAVLIPCTCAYNLIWGNGLCRYNQIKMRSIGWVLIQRD